MKNTGILEVARRYLLRIIFSKIFTDMWQHSVFAGGAKQIIFRLKFLCTSHLKIKYFELPPCLQNSEKKIGWDAHLMSYISSWLLLVSVILQISNLEAILYSRHFFDTPGRSLISMPRKRSHSFSWKKDCCLIIDAMSIRKQTLYDAHQDKYAGFVNYGDIPTNNPETIATEAVVFLLVGARSHWKCPIGYFLADKMC